MNWLRWIWTAMMWQIKEQNGTFRCIITPVQRLRSIQLLRFTDEYKVPSRYCEWAGGELPIRGAVRSTPARGPKGNTYPLGRGTTDILQLRCAIFCHVMVIRYPLEACRFQGASWAGAQDMAETTCGNG